MLLRLLIARLSYRRRLVLADLLLPATLTKDQEVAGSVFRTRRAEWAKFAMLGNAAALGAMLAAASWEGAGRSAAKALATSASGFVWGIALALASAGLGLWAELERVGLVRRRQFIGGDEPWSYEDQAAQHFEQDEYENMAHIWVPKAVSAWVLNAGATIALIGTATLFAYSAYDAVHRLQAVLSTPSPTVQSSPTLAHRPGRDLADQRTALSPAPLGR